MPVVIGVSTGWVIGLALGVVVVLVAAAIVIAVVLLANRIATQARTAGSAESRLPWAATMPARVPVYMRVRQRVHARRRGALNADSLHMQIHSRQSAQIGLRCGESGAMPLMRSAAAASKRAKQTKPPR